MANPQFEETMKRQTELAQEIGRRYAEKPKFVEEQRKELFGKETIIPALRSQKDKAIMELWETDKMLADRYAKPESEMFIEDPYKRESLVAGRHQDIFQNVAALTRAEESRRDTLGDILERGVKIFELGLTALEKEHGFLGSEIDDLLKKAAMEETKAAMEETKAAKVKAEAEKAAKKQEEIEVVGAIETLENAKAKGIDVSTPPKARALLEGAGYSDYVISTAISGMLEPKEKDVKEEAYNEARKMYQQGINNETIIAYLIMKGYTVEQAGLIVAAFKKEGKPRQFQKPKEAGESAKLKDPMGIR